MKRKVSCLIVLLWVAAVTAAALYDHYSWKASMEQAVFQDGCMWKDTCYLIEEQEEDSVLYITEPGGAVKGIALSEQIKAGSHYEKLAAGNDLYAVLAWNGQDEEGNIRTEYEMVRYDANGLAMAKTDPFYVEQQGTVSSLTVDGDRCYLTFVLDGGESAGVYTIDRAGFADLTADGGEEPEVEALKLELLERCPDGRLFTEAGYQDGRLVTWTDDGQGAESFTDQGILRYAFANRKLGLKYELKIRHNQVAVYVQILLVGTVVIVLLAVFLKKRNHVVYMILTVEAVLLAFTVAGAVLIPVIRRQARDAEQQRFGFYYVQSLAEEIGNEAKIFSTDDQSVYKGNDYYTIRNRLSRFVRRDEMADVFADICLVRTKDQVIVASASGHNGAKLDQIYGTSGTETLEKVAQGGKKAYTECRINGRDYGIFEVFVSNSRQPEYVLAGVSGIQREDWRSGRMSEYILYVEAFFAIASLVNILLLGIQGLELKRLAAAMRSMAEGQTDLRKGASHGKDVEGMWNSLLEIGRMINRIHYSKYQMFESCYRFAPKNIEKILGKDSITEVQGGDMITLQGTVAVISSAEPEDRGEELADTMNRFASLVERHQEEGKGFFVSGQANLRRLKVLFLSEIRNTAMFGISLLQELMQERSLENLKTCVLLHYTNCYYGVAGTEKQCFPFLISKEMEEMERFAAWFQRMGVRMVMTEKVLEREKQVGAIRYIGYIHLPGDETVKLYEALDACPGQERRQKINGNARFQKGLELLYQHDFYLARSTFSEVLKDNPTDRIAKWYVFTCEKYLNEAGVAGDVCSLERDERFAENG